MSAESAKLQASLTGRGSLCSTTSRKSRHSSNRRRILSRRLSRLALTASRGIRFLVCQLLSLSYSQIGPSHLTDRECSREMSRNDGTTFHQSPQDSRPSARFRNSEIHSLQSRQTQAHRSICEVRAVLLNASRVTASRK